jgi:outer membrane murein-binding lipoprotein Lpp
VIFAHLFQSASNLSTDTSALESSISALERAISALESEIKAFDTSSWEYAGFVFTFLVFAGVVLELWVIRHEWREDMETWALSYFGVSRSPARPSLTKLRIEIASVLLIGLGIAGELAVGIEVASINLKLRGKESELRSKNAELRSKSDQLLALVTQKAAEAQQKAGEANEKAESEHLARVRIEAAVAWRSLDDKQKQEIGAALASFSPKAGASIWYDSSSTEAQMFADDIAEALRYGHITTTNVGGMMSMAEGGKWNGPIVKGQTGVMVQSTNIPAAIEFASAVIKELSSRGFDATRTKDPPFEKGTGPVVWINVEGRPKGPQGQYKLQAEQQAKAKKQAKSK